MAWLKLIRWKNLLIIYFTQLLIWACVILPASKLYDDLPPLLLTPFHFSLIAVSTVLIAAAGYIINDYFDVRIDLINKPQKMILERKIPRRKAIVMHTVLNISGIFLAACVAAERNAYEWIILQIACTLLLWLYSTKFKRRFMIGNIVVALLTSLTILTLILYEPVMHSYLNKPVFEKSVTGFLHLNPLWLLGTYAYFAFILTWMREIVKDMEDLKGDAQEGCMTMPIKWGLKKSVHFTQLLAVLAVVPLILAAYKLFVTNNFLLSIYCIIALIIPLVIWLFYLNKKTTAEHYEKCSSWLKGIMVLGLGSLIINFLMEWLR